MNRESCAFALDFQARLAAGASGANSLFSPYSLYAVLAMTAEGARGETAREMGRAMRLPESMRRQGPDSLARPWDFSSVHASMGELTRSFARGAEAQSPEVLAHLDDLRARFAASDQAGVRAMQAGDHQAALAHDTAARGLYPEIRAAEQALDRPALLAANALWGEASYPFAPGFRNLIDDHYGSGAVRLEDFRHAPEAARHRINAWAADKTAQRITNAVPPGAVNALTRLVLANAVYFKGEWADFFDPNSREQPFWTADGGSTSVPLMGRVALAGYVAFSADGRVFPTPGTVAGRARPGRDDPAYYPGRGGFQVVELPYKNDEVAMVVVLPTSPDGLPALEQNLTAERLDSWITRLRSRSVNLLLPQFRIECDRNLTEDLQGLGMKRAFRDPATGSGADFSGMTSSADLNDSLFVSAVVQKSFIDVNERGTEAAAVTFAFSELATAALSRSRPLFIPIFRADRPFLFLIRHVPTGTILFMGRYARP
jgi:serine protease inhibitor